MTMPFEYKTESTSDNSPTLRLPPTWEPMHALDGAFTETQYIYGPTVASALKTSTPSRLLSVGLGLGYNEVLIACEALTQKTTTVFIDSYESVIQLRQFFASWILQQPEVPEDMISIYDRILELYSQKYNLQQQEIHEFLAHLLTTQQLQLHEAITPQTPFTPAHGILFDAFSSKSSPELWTEDFLNSFLKTASAPTCFLSTYASKGTLHRALKNNQFSTEKKPGFGFKRESTFAQRMDPTL